MPIYKGHQKSFAFTWQGQQYTFTFLHEDNVNSSTLYRHSPQPCWSSWHSTKHNSSPLYWWHWMSSMSNKQEVPSILNVLVRHTQTRGWDLTPIQFRGQSPQWSFSGSMVESMSKHLCQAAVPHVTTHTHTHTHTHTASTIGFFDFLRQHRSHLSVLFWPI